MPVQAPPWVELDDAAAALDDAERHGTPEQVAAARCEWVRAQQHCGAVGSLLLAMAFEHGGLAPQRRLGAAIAEMNEPTYRAAVRAVKVARAALDRLDALQQRVAELEEQLARVTPGIGEPGRTK